MRILIPVLGFGRAGGYRVLSEIANAWVRAGHEVDFLAPDTSGMPYFPTIAGIAWCDDKGLVLVDKKAREFSPKRGWQLLLSLYHGVKTIGNEYDVVLANHSFTTWPIWLARLSKPAKFYYIQAYEPEYYFLERRPLGWLFSRLSYALPFSQIANTEIYAHHIGVSGDKIVPFGIDLEKFWPKVWPTNFDGKSEIILGCIGRTEPAKGTKYILNAFEALWASDNRFRLRVAYGNLPDNWQHEAVETIMPQNDTELASFYRSLDILIAAGTVQHGAPHYPVLEGLASGLPVIHTGFLPGNDQNSWLARNKDATSIYEQVKIVTNHRDLSQKLQNAVRDVQPFAWDAVANRMTDFFAQSTNNNHLQPDTPVE